MCRAGCALSMWSRSLYRLLPTAITAGGSQRHMGLRAQALAACQTRGGCHVATLIACSRVAILRYAGRAAVAAWCRSETDGTDHRLGQARFRFEPALSLLTATSRLALVSCNRSRPTPPTQSPLPATGWTAAPGRGCTFAGLARPAADSAITTRSGKRSRRRGGVCELRHVVTWRCAGAARPARGQTEISNVDG
jgi:hypothetical protein